MLLIYRYIKNQMGNIHTHFQGKEGITRVEAKQYLSTNNDLIGHLLDLMTYCEKKKKFLLYLRKSVQSCLDVVDTL